VKHTTLNQEGKTNLDLLDQEIVSGSGIGHEPINIIIHSIGDICGISFILFNYRCGYLKALIYK